MIRPLLLATTFLSAFLLFLIQPLFAKYLLPFFGGTSSVWTISVFFYSAVLVLGYLYAAVLFYWSSKTALIVHGSLLLLMAAQVLSQTVFGNSVFILPVAASSPAVAVLLTLLAAIGLPVLLLASTSIIAQKLWARSVHADPYRLYAVSNAGSLLGLAAYPFLLEPFTTLTLQVLWWSVGFVFFSLLLVAVWRQSLRREVVYSAAPQLRRLDNRLLILLLAAIPTFLLTATTEYVSKGIASFPLIWVIPLLLYLLSFIVGFDGRRVRLGRLPLYVWITLSFVPLLIVLPFMNIHAGMYWLAFSYLLITFFLVSTFIHRRLYERRPAVADLGTFYVWLTIGGACGSGVVGFVLPVVLDRAIELPIVLGILALYFTHRTMIWLKRYVAAAAAVTVIRVYAYTFIVVMVAVLVLPPQLLTAERNFYGVITVHDIEKQVFGETVPVRTIINGATNHGAQARDDRYYKQPASYYGPGTGIDYAIKYFTESGSLPRVSVVGLGAGMIGSYCGDVSEIAYIEINPLVESVAREYFTYLALCPDKTSVTLGDGRLVLEGMYQADTDVFDVIMMDAFTDDAIPVHLLTKEAFENAYAPSLDAGGIVAFHVSNKYLRLQPPIVGAARQLGYQAVLVERSSDPENTLQTSSVWVLVALPEVTERLNERFAAAPYEGEVYVWTDERSSVLQALSLSGSAVR